MHNAMGEVAGNCGAFQANNNAATALCTMCLCGGCNTTAAAAADVDEDHERTNERVSGRKDRSRRSFAIIGHKIHTRVLRASRSLTVFACSPCRNKEAAAELGIGWWFVGAVAVLCWGSGKCSHAGPIHKQSDTTVPHTSEM